MLVSSITVIPPWVSACSQKSTHFGTTAPPSVPLAPGLFSFSKVVGAEKTMTSSKLRTDPAGELEDEAVCSR